jgi:predicted nucleotide-binding protein (sugar kinase/HSP70/actin superfamily)
MEIVLQKGNIMLELKQCLIRILDRAEQNAKQGSWLEFQADEFDLNDCLKQIKRELLEIHWSNDRRSRVSSTETTLQKQSEYAKNELIKTLKKEGI